MAELEISREVDCLCTSDIAERLEANIGNGATGEHVTRNHLHHTLRRDLLIGDSLVRGERERGTMQLKN